MPAASNAIAPKGGYNHASIYWLSPQTGSSTVGDIGIVTAPTSGTEYARFDGTGLSFRTNIIRNLSGTSFLLAANTSDGSDTASVGVCAGGAALTARGAVMIGYGNEHANAGQLVLLSGVGGGNCTIGAAGNSGILFYGNNSTVASMSVTGVFTMTGLAATRIPWDPTSGLAASGSMTIASSILREGDYWYDGPYIQFRLAVYVVFGGTASSTLKIPLPVAGVADHSTARWHCYGIDSNNATGHALWNNDGTYINVTAGSNWALTSGSFFSIQGIYRAN